MKTHFHYFLTALCVSIIISIPAAHSSKCIADQQQSSLLHFKNSLDFVIFMSSKLITWNSSTDCCSWVGITCNTDGFVLGLDISNEYVSGGIYNVSILSHLPYLQSLNLAGTGLPDHSNPYAIEKLTNLRYLNLSSNFYISPLPVENISRLTRLVVLDISVNYYDTQSSDLLKLVENLTKLRELYLDGVQISAQGSEWCQAISSSLPNLRVLSLSNCNLSGTFHESLTKLQSLSVIRLDKNNISAPVPGFFAKFSNLTVLSLGGCELRGTFPKEIFQLPSLQSIDLSNNNQLDGSLPEFSKNGSLEYLNLESTKFSGSLPNSIGSLEMLSTIDIAYCNFNGSIPKSMTNLTQLVSLLMSGNNFEGSVPSFRRAKNLTQIDLSSNGLTGNINFTHWRNLTNLSYLNFSHNMFDGNIPLSIFNLSSLAVLNIASNNFSGSIPLDGLQWLRNLEELDLSHNSLSLSHDATNFSYSSFPQLSKLRLASGKLTTFPLFLRNQSKLKELDLSENQIHGKIPNWMWRFSSLYHLNLSCNSLVTLEGPLGNNINSFDMLDLHSNQLHGQIPVFSFSPHYLDFSRNNFNNIPTNIGDLLIWTAFFSVSSNNLHGIIPESLCKPYRLEVLDMSNNSLSGTVPQCLTTIGTLAVLNLRRNNLTNVGKLSQDCNLKTLDISRNQIRGQFPKSLVNCTKLEVLNLGNNEITDPFPCFLKNTSTLRAIVLRSNKFYGRIGCHKTNGSWPMLQIIDLADNKFSGDIPGESLTSWQAMMANKDEALAKLNHIQFQDYTVYYQDSITVTMKGQEIEMVKILTIFTSIDLSCNKFTGSIPEEIGELKSLHVLNLSNNAFTGAIPSSLSNLSRLESLDLSKNNLSGQIPLQLTKLTFLEVLDLSNNQLVGWIPTSTQFSTFPKAAFEGNKDLSGFPLTTDNTTRLSPPTSRRSQPNSEDEINWDVISAEIGFTFGFGIAMGSLLFCKRWRKWYYRAMYNILLKIFPQLEERFGNHRRHVYIHQRHWRHLI